MRLNVVRHIVQCLIVLLFLSPIIVEKMTGALPSEWFFYGTLSSSTILGSIVIVDPFVALQSIAASLQLPVAQLLIGSVIVLVFYGIIRGRVFCGWVCPVNLILEIVEFFTRPLKASAKRQKRRQERRGTLRLSIDGISRRTKIMVAAGVLILSALCGIPVFELISPVGSVFRGLVLGAYVGIWLLLAIIILEIFFPGRLWCRKLCPLGGFYQLIGRLGFLSVKSMGGCIACNKCKDTCIADPSILDPIIQGTDAVVRSGDCMLCGKCVSKCSEKTLRVRVCAPLQKPVPKSD